MSRAVKVPGLRTLRSELARLDKISLHHSLEGEQQTCNFPSSLECSKNLVGARTCLEIIRTRTPRLLLPAGDYPHIKPLMPFVIQCTKSSSFLTRWHQIQLLSRREDIQVIFPSCNIRVGQKGDRHNRLYISHLRRQHNLNLSFHPPQCRPSLPLQSPSSSTLSTPYYWRVSYPRQPLMRFSTDSTWMCPGMNVAAGPELAATVTNAGGLGVIGGVGYTPKVLRAQVSSHALRESSISSHDPLFFRLRG